MKFKAFRMFVAFAFLLVLASGAFAQESNRVGVTGTVWVEGSAIVPPNPYERVVPWSVGVAFGKPASQYEILVERFSEQENLSSRNFAWLYAQTNTSDFTAVRAKKTWAIIPENKWFLGPTIGVFGGVAKMNRLRNSDYTLKCLLADEEYCRNTEIKPVEPKYSVSGPYVGVVLGAKKRIGTDMEVGVEYEVLSSFSRKFRVTATWWPGKK